TCKRPLVVPPPDRTQAHVPDGPIDGTPSSVARAGVDGGVTLPEAGPRAGPTSLPDLLARHAARGERYLLAGEIARGGMGAVLKGHDGELGRDIAVKVLLDSHAHSPELTRRFLEEAQINGQLQHPGIVPVYDLGVFADDRPYFTMKLVRGKTLAAHLAARREVQEDRAKYLGIFTQVCQTLAYAHARGVLHRDLKPSNIMVGSFGEVQVMDWGLAKVLARGGVPLESGAPGDSPASAASSAGETQEMDSRTQAGSVLGTPAYMAPEQARGEVQRVDERTDVFGLGGLLCEILTGKPPFPGRALDAKRKAQAALMEDAYARLDQYGEDAELIDLAKRCLAPEPADRPRHAGEVARTMTAYQQSVAERLRLAELARAAEEARSREAEATAAQERKAREAAQAQTLAERRSRRLALALAASVLVTVLGGGGGWLWLVTQRQHRLDQNNQAIQAALNEGQTLQERARAVQGPVAMAIAVQAREQIQRAHALVESGPADPALAAQVEVLRDELAAEDRDRQFLAALESARSAPAEISDSLQNRFAAEKALPLFREAFRAYGLPAGEGPAETAAARLRARPPAVREEILAALDEWIALAEDPRWKVQEPQLPWLRAVLTAAEPAGWEAQVRAAAAEHDLPRRRSALEKLANAADVAHLPPRALTLLAQRLQGADAGPRAVALLQQAYLHHAGDFWINLNLGVALRTEGQKATSYLTAAVALRPKNAKARTALAYSLRDDHQWKDAAGEFSKSIELDPQDANSHHGLGLILYQQGDSAGALKEYHQAVALEPRFANPHNAIGYILAEQGKLPEALAEYRRAIELDPDFALPYFNRADVLRRQRKLADAVREYHKAIEVAPRFSSGYQGLGLALFDQEKYAEAGAAFRKAIELDPTFANPHNGLGIALRAQGKFEAAIAEFRKALELDSRFSYARKNLKETEHLLHLEQTLPRILAGQARPASAAECLEYANLCSSTERDLAAARLYRQAFTMDPKRAEDVRSEDRYDAACCACLAANGQGADAKALPAPERRRWRKQALDWLRAELATYGKLLASGAPKERAWVRQRLEYWQRDSDLASLRDKSAIGNLADDQRQACRRLWADVETLLRKARNSHR
ncbi:MAG TPA: tetratricopeptide repeat protein, partial [Gemmataceae bacterium]|nr:tetratricopeptide repeat protein [Gemmataceae bacterium]